MASVAKGWILYRADSSLVKQESYEIERLLETAPKYGYEVEVVNPDDLSFVIGMGGDPDLYHKGELVNPLPQFVIPRMGSATSYFALAGLRHLEKLGVVCVNNANSVTLAQDKLYHLQKLSDAGFPVPKTMLVQFPVNIDLVEKEIGFPTVVKLMEVGCTCVILVKHCMIYCSLSKRTTQMRNCFCNSSCQKAEAVMSECLRSVGKLLQRWSARLQKALNRIILKAVRRFHLNMGQKTKCR